MRFLNWNHRKVQNLTPWEIWGFVAGRVFMSFGLGVLAVQYYPQMSGPLGVPCLVIGVALLVFAARGLTRRAPARIAPEPVLRAGNDTICWACVFCRNQSLGSAEPVKMINDVMEAIHEVPRMLIDWERHDLAEIRLHLSGFAASRWPGAPDLVSYFDKRLKEYGDEVR